MFYHVRLRLLPLIRCNSNGLKYCITRVVKSGRQVPTHETSDVTTTKTTFVLHELNFSTFNGFNGGNSEMGHTVS